MTVTQFAHTIGDKYEDTKDLDITDIRKLVLADIKAAAAAGKLPRIATKKDPDGITVSARCERYSMGQSINVYVTLQPGHPDRVPADDPRSCAYDNYLTGSWDGFEIPQHTMTAETSEITDLIGSLLDAYNYNNSDSMTDYYHVRFSANVVVRKGSDG